MKREEPIEMFMPPNMLKAKMGSGHSGIDMAALKRAEQAMEELKGKFGDWLIEDLRVLATARSAYAENQKPEARAALLRAAHDIKGQAATFSYPLIARVAGSLSKLIGELPEATTLPVSLIDAHVNAILVIHKQAMQDTADAVALALCKELEARVEELLPSK